MSAHIPKTSNFSYTWCIHIKRKVNFIYQMTSHWLSSTILKCIEGIEGKFGLIATAKIFAIFAKIEFQFEP